MKVVEGDDLGPIFRHLWQVQALAELIMINADIDDDDEGADDDEDEDEDED